MLSRQPAHSHFWQKMQRSWMDAMLRQVTSVFMHILETAIFAEEVCAWWWRQDNEVQGAGSVFPISLRTGVTEFPWELRTGVFPAEFPKTPVLIISGTKMQDRLVLDSMIVIYVLSKELGPYNTRDDMNNALKEHNTRFNQLFFGFTRAGPVTFFNPSFEPTATNPKKGQWQALLRVHKNDFQKLSVKMMPFVTLIRFYDHTQGAETIVGAQQ
jgi:hypothetical protein